ncbi:MAG: sugar transferase [Chloroflexi bacterium]|nr:sugar transferase [Chloroflexota bacterium]
MNTGLKRLLTVTVLLVSAALLAGGVGLLRYVLVQSAGRNGQAGAVNRERALALKRLFDIVVSAVALLALSPVLVIIAVAVRLSSPGPIFYRATRVGRNGQPITVYKFRSMVVNADTHGPGITVSGDGRVTPIGRMLRRYKLDELPQLFNVLQGTMSLVGPRPEDPRYVACYSPEQRQVLQVAPGITSPASVYYRDEESLLTGDDWQTRYLEQIMPAKLAIDLEYVQNVSLARDLEVLWDTFRTVWQQPLLDKIGRS